MAVDEILGTVDNVLPKFVVKPGAPEGAIAEPIGMVGDRDNSGSPSATDTSSSSPIARENTAQM